MNEINKLKSCRNTNIEILRLFLMIAILGWHIIIHGMGFNSMGGQMNIDKSLEIFFIALFAPATYCFMFISGLKLSLNKITLLELCLILCSVLTFFLKYCLFDIFSVRSLVYSFIPVSTMKWWFMTCYMLLLLMSPILDNGVKAISKKNFSFILISLIIYHVFSFLLLKDNAGSNFLGLLTMFLIGRYCYIYKFDIKKNKALFVFMLSWSLLFFLLYASTYFCKSLVFKILNYNTPLIMIMAIMAFYFVKNLKPIYSYRINKALKSTLFIYLISEGLGLSFYTRIAGLFIGNRIFLGIFVVLVYICISLAVGQALLSFTAVLLKKLKIDRFKI